MGEQDMKRLGPLCTPYGLSEKQRQIIWDAVNTNIVDVLASDHAPHTEDEMQPGWKDAWSIPFGNPQLDHFVSILLTKANEKFTTIENIIEKCSENPAKLLGIYPRKGVIQIGSDADFTIIDPHKKMTLSNNNLYTKVGWSPYKDWQINGCPVMTIVRGDIVMQDGKVTAKPGCGKFISGTRA
ncbi:amidohydrolase family protein [Thermodesulfobacteriota bacterium]